MSTINKYLEMLHEGVAFSASVAMANINGEFKQQWTNCYNKDCLEGEEADDVYARRFCKAACQIDSCRTAISRLNALRSNCTNAGNPKQCLDSLNNKVKYYNEKIASAKRIQTDANAKAAQFNRQAAAGE